ncbi:TauD/TfdA family dioxygenase [Streptomyces sp. NBC_00102]|uniref:TauD/TfdA family dioxygenase n=1 Tax=Streptomyces sp. NBC_00102 TaxID=2975652 RepID=UPI0022591E0D|nr:TauD/TfdA family dioxygenase [Streptomyces sp. NBC_00102]MCX5398296.1 TauD/TfdA family dioxygenase [Streptomyces sp. NBC_00102]
MAPPVRQDDDATTPAAPSRLRLVRLRLDDGTRDLVLKELTARLVESVLDSDDDEAVLAHIGAYVLRSHLPGQLLDSLRLFPATGCHALVLGNLPVQEFGPTPVSGFGDEPSLSVVNALHFGLIQLLGVTPFAVSYENHGRLIRNVVPNPAAAGTTSSWGADSEFFWHTDNPHLPFGTGGSDPRRFVPQYLTFYTVRNEERVPTEITAVEDAVEALSPEQLRRLEQPHFAVGAPDSNDFDASPQLLDEIPIFERDPSGQHQVRYDRGTARGLSPHAAGGLTQFSDALSRVPSTDITLASGDFLIFDNYRVLHRRRAFEPGPAATARWLRRCYAS